MEALARSGGGDGERDLSVDAPRSAPAGAAAPAIVLCGFMGAGKSSAAFTARQTAPAASRAG